MRLGELLIAKQLIQQEDLDRALELQKERGEKIGKLLVELGFVAQRDRPLQPSQGLDTSALSLRRPSAPTADDNDSPPRAWNR